MSEDASRAVLGQRFGQVHRVFDYGDNGLAWLADPGFVHVRTWREFMGTLRARLYIAELAWSGGRWCIEVSVFDPRSGRALGDRHAGITAFDSEQRAQSTLRAWALLLAGKFNHVDDARLP